MIKESHMPKTKSMRGKQGGRKLAAKAARKTQKSGGEPQKGTARSRGSSRRTRSSKQRKG
jgi:hypothetical protein